MNQQTSLIFISVFDSTLSRCYTVQFSQQLVSQRLKKYRCSCGGWVLHCATRSQQLATFDVEESLEKIVIGALQIPDVNTVEFE